MVFNLGIVPDSFSLGILTPVPKKGKPLCQCSSFRPVTVATVFCKLFEALIVDELRSKCTVPDHQFGFQPSLGCGHALSALVSTLIDAEKSVESIALAAHDVRRAFDSLIHEQIILDMDLVGVDPSMLNPLYDVYQNLKAELKLPTTLDLTSNPVLPVKKGVRLCALTSPTAFNNSTVKPQSKSNLTYILRGIDLSLISYADDVLNLSCLLRGLEENFIQFQVKYGKIGLQFNEEKSDVMLFNAKQGSAVDVRLVGATVRLAEHIVYLGIPIGWSMLETRHLLQSHLQKQISLAYSRVVVYKCQFDWRISAHPVQCNGRTPLSVFKSLLEDIRKGR